MIETANDGARHAEIDLAPDAFRAAGHALVDRMADLLGSMRQRKVTSGISVPALRSLVDEFGDLPEHGTDAATIVTQAAELLTAHSLYNGHPRFLGYVTSSPAPIGMLADLLAAGVNSNVGSWTLSPAATEIEAQTIRWIAQLIGYPADCGGVMVSGGNMANFVGLYTALRAAFPRDAADPARLHDDRTQRATVYASGETHTWIDKALAMFGLPPDALRTVRVDAQRRLVVDDLRQRLAVDRREGRIPVAVIGSAGTVSTGAVDPLAAMAALCRDERVWLHVDGAYGGFAAMLDPGDDVPADLHALAQADSVAIDPHKWLYAPLEAGCALVRDAALQRAAFAYHPPYYHFGVEATNFVDLGPQNSRGFRALKVWMGLRQAGRQGYRRMLADDIALARELHARMAADRRFEAATHGLSITTFRYVPEHCRSLLGEATTEDYLNAFNKALQARLETTGDLFVSNAVLDGRYLLRACIVNFRTSRADIAVLPDLIDRHAQALLAEDAVR